MEQKKYKQITESLKRSHTFDMFADQMNTWFIALMSDSLVSQIAFRSNGSVYRFWYALSLCVHISNKR